MQRSLENEPQIRSPLISTEIVDRFKQIQSLYDGGKGLDDNTTEIARKVAELTQPGVVLSPPQQNGIDFLLQKPQIKEEVEIAQIDYTGKIDPDSLVSDRARELLEKLTGATEEEIIGVQTQLAYDRSLPKRDFRRLNRLAYKLLDDLDEQEPPQVIKVTSTRRPFFKAGVGLAAATVVGTPLALFAARPHIENQRLDKEAGVGQTVFFKDISGIDVAFSIKRRAEIPGFVYIEDIVRGEAFDYPIPHYMLNFKAGGQLNYGDTVFVDEGGVLATEPGKLAGVTGAGPHAVKIVSTKGERITHPVRLSKKALKPLSPGDYCYDVAEGGPAAYSSDFYLVRVTKVLPNEKYEYQYIDNKGEPLDDILNINSGVYLQRMPNLFTEKGWLKKK